MIENFLKEFGIKMKVETHRLGHLLFSKPDKKLLAKHPVYSGECVAHVRGEKLVPSIGLLQKIGKQAKHKITVTAKGEWLLICGRDLAGKHITEHTSPEIGERVVILNQQGECIGYGDIAATFDSKQKAVKRLFDIGDLLRRVRRR